MASGSESISLDLREAWERISSDFEISRSKIQPVPRLFKEGDKYDKYCRPKIISIGPIHHRDPKLKPGEEYKRMWAFLFAEDNGKRPEDLHERVLDNIADLRKLFSWDEIGNAYNDQDLAFMLLVDGCSIIQILEKDDLSRADELKIKVDELLLVQRDLLLLENQLPYQVLQLLVDDEMQLKLSMRRFCELHNMFKVIGSTQHSPFLRERTENSSQPDHLLRCLYETILSNYIDAEEKAKEFFSCFPVNSLREEQITYRSIRELKASAIQIKRMEKGVFASFSRSGCFFFNTARLCLCPLILDDSTIPILLNLVAYEMCFDSIDSCKIISFVKFLDLLIDDPEDVKELRREGILQHSLGSDEQVSEFFNTIGSSLVKSPYDFPLLKRFVEWHYKNKCRFWMAEAYYTHCRSPWTIIALTAAITLLIFTFIQTINSF